MAMNARDCSGKILKKLLIGSGVLLAVFLLSGYLFARLYFKRTFAHQLSNMVVRCSDGIQVKSAGDDWLPLKVGQTLKMETRITMPDVAESFMSFDGVRLLGKGLSEIEISGSRSFSLINGDIAVAAARMDKPLRISLGASLLTTGDSVIKVSGADGSFSVECISGAVNLKGKKDAEHKLEAGQSATLSNGKVQIAAAQVQDPFAARKVSVIERIKERFDRMISKYAHVPPTRRERTQSGWFDIYPSDGAGAGLAFASYVRGNFLNLARTESGRSIADYYETLFAPSNRSISIGRQKVVPVTPDYAASFPIWSHDGSMIAFIEAGVYSWQARVRVVRLDDLDNPWDISQERDDVLPFFPIAWAPDDRHMLFMVPDSVNTNPGARILWEGPYHIKIAPVDPAEGPIMEFNSPFRDIWMPLPLPIGKTISPVILKLPWGDAVLCANWGNMAYVPIEEDGQAVPEAPGLFLTNFNPRDVFVGGGLWSPSGSKIFFVAAENLDFDNVNAYILYEVEDILDGFAEPPRSLDDPRIKRVAPSPNPQLPGNFSYDESLVFYQEDVNDAWRAMNPQYMTPCDFDLFYADARPDQPSSYTQIHLPGNQMFLRLSPEGNRLVYSNYRHPEYELRVVSFDIEADMDMDLGGVLIDNSGTNLIVPPGTLEENFNVKISTPFTIGEEAEIPVGETRLFALRLLDAQGLEKPKFIEPMTFTIRYTDDEVAGLDEGMLEIYYYDESDPEHPAWVPLGGTVDPEHNEITVEIRHFSKFSVGGNR